MCPSHASGALFIDDYLPLLLARAADAVSGEGEAALRRPGITAPVWRVLAALADLPGPSVTSMAKTCLLQQPTMTKLLIEMERNGLVRRHRDGQDRRVVRVALTSVGEALAADLMSMARQYEAALLSRHPRAAEIKDVLRDLIAQPGGGQESQG